MLSAVQLNADATLRHERTHVIQHDFIFRAWTDPLEQWAAGQLLGELLRSHLDYEVAWPTLRYVVESVTGSVLDDPIEVEAKFLAGE